MNEQLVANTKVTKTEMNLVWSKDLDAAVTRPIAVS